MKLGAYIKRQRLSEGLSLRGVARKVGISPTYLSLVESDKHLSLPTADRLEKLAKALKCDGDALCFMAGRVPSDVQAAISRFPKQVTHVLRYTGVTKMKRSSL